jgi:hypothetical protein
MIERRWRRNWKGIEELRRMEWDLVAWCSGKDEGKEKNLVLHRKWWRKKKVTMLILYTV